MLALVCAVLLPAPPPAAPRAALAVQSLLGGLHYVWQDPTVLTLMLLQAIPAFLMMPYNQMLPIFARDILHAGPGGPRDADDGDGGRVGAGLGGDRGAAGAAPGRVPVRVADRLGLLLVAFAMSTSLTLSIGIMGLIGVAQAIYLATNNTLVQLAVPDALQGRVMSVYMTTWGLMPLGALPQGVLADWFGAPSCWPGPAC